MCVIAAKPAGVSWLSHNEMRNCFTRNSDGAGIAWADNEGLHMKKGFFKWKPLWQELKRLEGFSVLLHCRLATHGSKVADNCHPFALSNRLAMAHNGVIGIKVVGDMTDSETFGKRYIEAFTQKDLKKLHVQELIEAAIGPGNKIVCLNEKGEFIFFNKKAGHEKDGIWFSNSSYQVVRSYTYNHTYMYEGDTYEALYKRFVDRHDKKKAHEDYCRCDCCTKPISACGTCNVFGAAIDDMEGDIYDTGCDDCERAECLGSDCPVYRENVLKLKEDLEPKDSFGYLSEEAFKGKKIA